MTPTGGDRMPEIAAVLGAGAWGTTFAKVLADAGVSQVRLWARRPELAERIEGQRVNDEYLPGVVLPETVRVGADASAALAGARLVAVAVPAQTVRAVLPGWRDSWPADAVLVSLMKGIEVSTGLRMSQVLCQAAAWPADRVAVVSGPNLAREIAEEQPTATVVASVSRDTAEFAAAACAAPYFRPYTQTDVVGVELGGAVKNVIALAVGICEGQGLGDNSKASIITRGLAEITRLAVAHGADPATLAGLAGLGDLVATCASPLSRNRTAGVLLGEGFGIEEVRARPHQTTEGLKSGRAVLELARAAGVDMPITQAVVAVIEGRIAVGDMATRLLSRARKDERQ